MSNKYTPLLKRGRVEDGGVSDRLIIIKVLAKPGMFLNRFQWDSVGFLFTKTSLHQALNFVWEFQIPEPHQAVGHNLLVSLERDVSTEHVVEEDPQAPDGEAVRTVASGSEQLEGD